MIGSRTETSRARKLFRGLGSGLVAASGVALVGAGALPVIDLGGDALPLAGSVVEVVIVDSQSPTGSTTLTALEGGKTYSIEVTGTYEWGLGSADAECSTQAPDTTWQRTRYPEPTLDLAINGGNFEWEPVGAASGCSPEHTYRLALTLGFDQQLNFNISEGFKADNSGLLRVKIVERSVEDGVETVRQKLDEIQGTGLGLVPSTIPETPSTTIPGGPTTTVPGGPPTSIPAGPSTTVPDSPSTTVPDTPPTTVPESPSTTVPDTPPTTLPDGEDPDPGPVAEAIDAVLQEAEQRAADAQADAERFINEGPGDPEREVNERRAEAEADAAATRAAGEQAAEDAGKNAGDAVGGAGVPGVSPQPNPDPDTDPNPRPNPDPNPAPSPGPGSNPDPAPSGGSGENPGSPPVGGDSAPSPGEDGDPGTSLGAAPPVGVAAPESSGKPAVAGKRTSRPATGDAAAADGNAGGYFGFEDDYLTSDLDLTDGADDDTDEVAAAPRSPYQVAKHSRTGMLLTGALLFGLTGLLGLRAVRRVRAERAYRAYRYR